MMTLVGTVAESIIGNGWEVTMRWGNGNGE